MRYLDDARKVPCLKSLVRKAEQQLAQTLAVNIKGKGVQKSNAERSFDLLLQLGHAHMLKSDKKLRSCGLQICERRLKDATCHGNSQQLKWAMLMAVRAQLYPSAELDKAIGEASAQYAKVAGLPQEWDVKRMLSSLWDGRMLSKSNIEDSAFISGMQRLLDDCTKKIYTRDRRGGRVPDRLLLAQVIHVQNEQLFMEYNLRQNALRADLAKRPPALWSSSVLSSHRVEGRPQLDSAINEVWLFHGTKHAAAANITENDFRLDLAGTSTGTLFGSGIYVAEAATKADEYTEADSNALRCILLCRVTLGRCLYIDSVDTDPDDCTQKCLSGEYHSVLGDREKCRGTYREFVVFDNDQLLPEYILLYRRAYILDE